MKYVIFLLLIGLTEACPLEEEQTEEDDMKELFQVSDNVFATCNLVLFKEMVDYKTADKKCEKFTIGEGRGSHKGNLATVDDDDKNTELKTLLGLAYPKTEKNKNVWHKENWVWAGLKKIKNLKGENRKNKIGKKKNRKNKNGRKKNEKSDNFIAAEWQWSDGITKVKENYTGYWMEKQPDQTELNGSYQNQMRVNNAGKWDDTFECMKHAYACDYQGKYLFSKSHKTWEEAKQICENAGLILAMVRDEDEVKEFTEAAENILGPINEEKRWDADNWLWLGAKDMDKRIGKFDFEWVEGGDVVEKYKNKKILTKKYNKYIDNSMDKENGVNQEHLALSKSGKFDDSYKPKPFACQCPGT